MRQVPDRSRVSSPSYDHAQAEHATRACTSNHRCEPRSGRKTFPGFRRHRPRKRLAENSFERRKRLECHLHIARAARNRRQFRLASHKNREVLITILPTKSGKRSQSSMFGRKGMERFDHDGFSLLPKVFGQNNIGHKQQRRSVVHGLDDEDLLSMSMCETLTSQPITYSAFSRSANAVTCP